MLNEAYIDEAGARRAAADVLVRSHTTQAAPVLELDRVTNTVKQSNLELSEAIVHLRHALDELLGPEPDDEGSESLPEPTPRVHALRHNAQATLTLIGTLRAQIRRAQTL